MFNIFSKLLDVNQREVDRLSKTVEKINENEVKLKTLKESDFSKKTEDFKKKIEAGSVLEEILPESFAMAREAGVRTLGKRLFDVQLMAAIALFEGKIAE